MAAPCLVVLMCVWLGGLLWSGQAIPKWFILATAAFFGLTPVVACLARREFPGELEIVGMLCPSLLAFYPQIPSKKPAKPVEFEDLA